MSLTPDRSSRRGSLEEIQWSGTDIVVLNQVTIKAPYQTANMDGQPDSQAYKYVSKIVSSRPHHQWTAWGVT